VVVASLLGAQIEDMPAPYAIKDLRAGVVRGAKRVSHIFSGVEIFVTHKRLVEHFLAFLSSHLMQKIPSKISRCLMLSSLQRRGWLHESRVAIKLL
jgi:hypothetical protein